MVQHRDPPRPLIDVAISFGELVVLAAALMSAQAIAMDAMLPALPAILRSLHVSNDNQGQWVITAYLIGVGIGQPFWGILSDRFGRRAILLAGLGMYCVSTAASGFATHFEQFVALRLVQGLAGGCTVVTRSIIRDLYSGRHMARVMSLTFIVLMIVPVIAPSIGQLVLLAAPWPVIFFAFSAFASAIWLWACFRLPETLHPEYRMTLTAAHIGYSVLAVLTRRASLWYTLAVTMLMGSLIAYIGMVEQIFTDIFHRARLMPAIFALCASAMAVASFFNSRVVERLGMRRISHTALLALIAISVVHVIIVLQGDEGLLTFLILQAATMACFSLASPNFGAMAMEPLAESAGIGASLQGFVTTFVGAVVGALIGRQFNGSTYPLALGSLICGLMALVCVLVAEKGRLFQAQHADQRPEERWRP